MRTIAIETSSDIGSVAAIFDGNPLGERTLKEGLARGRNLMVELDLCVKEAQWNRHDIELVAVSVGPGSYTGLRLGIATAKGLAYALRIPVIAVMSLDAIAENAPRTADHVAVVSDARRGQIYGAFYSNVGFSFFREAGPELSEPEEFAARLHTPVFVLGDAIRKYPEAFAKPGFTLMPEAAWRPRAASVGLLGEKAYLLGGRTDAAALEPLYLRLPEAEEKWRAMREPRAAGEEGAAGQGGAK